MKKKILLISLLTLYIVSFFSQEDQKFWNNKIGEIAEENSSDNYLYIKQDINISVNDFFKDYKTALYLSENDEMILEKIREDKIGFIHYHYQQYYNNIKVEGGEYILHEKNGAIKFANGYLIKNLKINTIPLLTKEEAIQAGMIYTKGNLFSWQLDTSNYLYSKFPQAELVIAKKQDNKTHTLMYKFHMISIKPNYKNIIIYVDAKTGEIIKEEQSISTVSDCIAGEVNTLFNGNRNIWTRKVGSNYYLIDECKDYRINVKRFISQAWYTVFDNNNTFVNTYFDRMAGSAYWAAKMASDYFFYTFGLNSYDDNNGEILIKVDRPYNAFTSEDATIFRDNAFWYPPENTIYVTEKYNLSNHAVSLDIIAHEFTHGIAQYSANFIKSGESDALNESFADIFGTMIEFYTLGNTANYLIAENLFAGGLRNMSNPNQKYHPDTYLGNYWNINNAPHTNSGVQNYWFYLLAEGGSGINDNGEAYSVQGIGKAKAAQIAFYSLQNMLTSSSVYADAKNCAIISAMLLFGDCSNEVVQTINAWKAVGVPSELGIYYNKVISQSDIATINFLNQLGLSVKIRALNNLESNQIHSYNNAINNEIIFVAGNNVFLKQGFKSGKYFKANIFECINNAKSTNHINSDYTLISETYNKEITIKDNSQINIYPNPNNGAFIVDYQDVKSKILKIEIFSANGVLVYKSLEKEREIKLANATSGLYYAIITLSDKIISQKIIIK